MRYFILYISLIWCCVSLSAQQLSVDSLQQINEISITAKKNIYPIGERVKINDLSNTSVALEQFSPIYLNRQSSNGLATISIRGSAATNVPVQWENWTINSSMNSLFDVNLINPYLFDELIINYGDENTNTTGWGGAGGSLNFSNSKNTINNSILKSKHCAGLHLQLGSFGHNEYGLNYQFTSNQFQNNFKIVRNTSINDFPILKEEGTVLDRPNNVNAEVENIALTNKCIYKIDDDNSLELNAWWHYTKRQIPPTLLASNSMALQTDSAGRFSINWKNSNNWNVAFAYFDELNLFESTATNIYGEHRVKSWLSKFKQQLEISEYSSFDYSVRYENYFAQSTNLNEDGVRRSRLVFQPSFTHKFKEIPVNSTVGITSEYVDSNFAPILPSLKLESNLNNKQQIKFLISRHFRLPSFNDLYWQPGGNVNLIAESGWNQELSYSLTLSSFAIKTSLFNNNIDNKIIWLPKQGLWQPNNIAKVNSNGAEVYVDFKHNYKKFNYKADAFYAYTKSVNVENENGNSAVIGKQLIYIPKHKAGASLSINYNNVHFNWSQVITGKRFTNSDNTNSINAYHLADASIGYPFKIKKSELEASFVCHNLFNKYYEVVQNRPMPARNYLININYKL